MLRFLELAWDAIRGTALRFAEWIEGLAAAGAFDPRTWQPVTWIALGVVVVALLVWPLVTRLRRRGSATLPELMVSHGEIALVDEPGSEASGYDLAAPPGASHQLRLTLSNLNPWPVQFLELAVRTRGLRQPVVAEAGSVVPPNGAVDVEVELFDLPGDAGMVELYVYSNRGGRRTYKLSAPLEWEPWDRRYRIRSLSARVVPVATLASQEKRRREKRLYRSAKRRERQRELADATWRRAEELTRQVKERRAAAAERRAAATAEGLIDAEQVASGALSSTVPHGVAETVYSGAAAAPAPRRERAPDAPRPPAPEAEQPREEPRRRLEFPDEF